MKMCSICGEQYTQCGNNAQPVNDGRCCDYCDCLVVLPKRMSMSQNQPREKFISLGYNILTELKRRREGIELRTGSELTTGQSPVV